MNTRSFLQISMASVVMVASAFAADTAGAKNRMRQRVPQVDKLKVSGAVGENNKGFLEVKQAGGDAAQVVAEENSDRQMLFSETAGKTGSSADAIGKAFAQKMAADSAPGVWIQKADGSWIKK